MFWPIIDRKKPSNLTSHLWKISTGEPTCSKEVSMSPYYEWENELASKWSAYNRKWFLSIHAWLQPWDHLCSSSHLIFSHTDLIYHHASTIFLMLMTPHFSFFSSYLYLVLVLQISFSTLPGSLNSTFLQPNLSSKPQNSTISSVPTSYFQNRNFDHHWILPLQILSPSPYFYTFIQLGSFDFLCAIHWEGN